MPWTFPQFTTTFLSPIQTFVVVSSSNSKVHSLEQKGTRVRNGKPCIGKMTGSGQIKCVIFDIGGVVVGSPLSAINDYEEERGLPRNWINIAITQQGTQGAFQRFERNEIDLYSFYKKFGEELSNASQNNEWYRKFCEMRDMPVPNNLPESFKIDGRELFGCMMQASFNPDPKMLQAINILRESGRFKVAALTNNFQPPSAPSPEGETVPSLDEEVKHLGLGPHFKQLKEFFHLFIESSKVGLRKPDPEIYKYALRELQVEPHEAVFLDDIGINLKAAKKLGIVTIRVQPTSSVPALQELEKIVGMQLLDEEDVQD
ncbi:unnamed protein product [Tilletia controversa]|nr:unnamed protein product [Tilletia controversa]